MTSNRLPGPDADGRYGTDYVLLFVGKFAGVQFHIDTAVRAQLESHMTVLGPVVADQLLTRVRDDQRRTLIIALADEVKYSGDLRNFKYVFDRAKSARDLFGHAQQIAEAWNPANGSWALGVATRAGTKWPDLLPSPLVVDSVKGLIADCEWMSAVVTRLLFEMGWRVFALDGTDLEPPVPPATAPNGLPIPTPATARKARQ